METELARLANEVADLRTLIMVSMGLIAGVLVTLVAFLVMAIRTNKLAYDRSTASMFKDEAGHLFDVENYEKLIEICLNRLQSKPGDAWAHFYLANAYYRRGEWAKSKEYYINAKSMEPLFSQHAEDALKEIEVALSNSKPRGV